MRLGIHDVSTPAHPARSAISYAPGIARGFSTASLARHIHSLEGELLMSLRRAFGLVPLLLLAACPRRYAVWLEPDSTVQRLSFGVGANRHAAEGIEVGLFLIATCGDHDAAVQNPGMFGPERLKRVPWSIVSTEALRTLTELRYGQVPAGFRQISEPAKLGAGCYVAEASGANAGGTGYVRFRLDSAGRARELPLAAR